MKKLKLLIASDIKLAEDINAHGVHFPEYMITENLENAGQKLIQGKVDNNYYFLKEGAFNDTFYIEEDKFEAKFIVTNFFKDLDIEGHTGSFDQHEQQLPG